MNSHHSSGQQLGRWVELKGWGLALALALAIVLAACGGSSSTSSTSGGPGSPRTIAVYMQELLVGQQAVLQNNGGDDLTVTANGSASFATKVGNTASYNVTVKTQPGSQICAPVNGSGTLNGGDANVLVTCASNPGALWSSFNQAQGFTVFSNPGSDDVISALSLANGFLFGVGSSDMMSFPFSNDGAAAVWVLSITGTPNPFISGLPPFGSNGIVKITNAYGGANRGLGVAPGTLHIAGSSWFTASGPGTAAAHWSLNTLGGSFLATPTMNVPTSSGDALIGKAIAMLSGGPNSVLAGSWHNGNVYSLPGLWSYTSSLNLAGSATIDDGGGDDGANAVVSVGGNTVAMAGFHRTTGTPTDQMVAVWQGTMSPGWTADATFGIGGLATVPYAGGGATGPDEGSAMALDANGKIVVAGYATDTGSVRNLAVWRFNADGTLDTTFASPKGYTLAKGLAGGTGPDEALAVMVDSAGRIVVAGRSANAAGRSAAIVGRFTAAGVPDAAFGTDGVIVLQGTAGGTGVNQFDAATSLLATSSFTPGGYYVGGMSRSAAGDLEAVLWGIAQ